MRKMSFCWCIVAALAAISATTAFAQPSKTTRSPAKSADEKKETNAKEPAAKEGAKKEPETTGAAKKGEQPKGAPGWVVIEEDWWLPFRYDFSEALRNARTNYVNREEKAAAAEIDKAVAWLKFAENVADKATSEDLATARADLEDFADAFRHGEKIEAKKYDAAFARASAALSKHHYFKATKAIAKDDLKTAGEHLKAAADHLRDAARTANYEYGQEVTDIYESYAPYGYWDETIAFEQSQLEMNLKTIKEELAKLAAKLGAKK
jgi:hypothetical protein